MITTRINRSFAAAALSACICTLGATSPGISTSSVFSGAPPAMKPTPSAAPPVAPKEPKDWITVFTKQSTSPTTAKTLTEFFLRNTNSSKKIEVTYTVIHGNSVGPETTTQGSVKLRPGEEHGVAIDGSADHVKRVEVSGASYTQ